MVKYLPKKHNIENTERYINRKIKNGKRRMTDERNVCVLFEIILPD